ncbi:MAG TPA: MarR family transcriptional regulator [Rhodanobacteraceae bacterium]|nr:MarR family transcriptional regulator [Rhodanobacteraceae bacterium]
MGKLLEYMQGIETGVSQVSEQMPTLPQQDVMLVRLLHLAAEGLTARFLDVLRPHGLNESDFRVLMQLYSCPSGSAYPSELCAFVVQTPTNMTRIADALVRRKLVTRKPGEHDRRRIELRITLAGRRFVGVLLPKLFPLLRTSFSGLDDREKRTLQGLLQRVIVSVDETP